MKYLLFATLLLTGCRQQAWPQETHRGPKWDYVRSHKCVMYAEWKPDAILRESGKIGYTSHFWFFHCADPKVDVVIREDPN